jgi:hypothetical protein
MTLTNRILHGIAFAVRVDIAASVAITAALLIWTIWH